MKREFLQLAEKFEFGKHAIGGYYLSEKIDGIRCFWDGGITTGVRCAEVPWANTAKHHRFVNEPIATGLWTRYGQPLRAPNWWLETLPKMPLDGELTCGRQTWQQLSSIVKSHSGLGWDKVKFLVFDSPSLPVFLQDGTISNGNYKKQLSGCWEWAFKRISTEGILVTDIGHDLPFYKVNARFTGMDLGPHTTWLKQKQLPHSSILCEEIIKKELEEIEGSGGEGVILREAISLWSPHRSKKLLKVKTLHDMEGIVVGYKFAKETDLEKSLTGEVTNKLLGLMGSVRVKLDSGIEFDLSGFTDAERYMGTRLGYDHPGEEVPEDIEHPIFKRGSKITFRYRELSSEGVPKEARYWRQHVAGF